MTGESASRFERLPPHILDNILGHIPNIRTRMRLEMVSKNFAYLAREFCWSNDQTLEVMPAASASASNASNGGLTAVDQSAIIPLEANDSSSDASEVPVKCPLMSVKVLSGRRKKTGVQSENNHVIIPGDKLPAALQYFLSRTGENITDVRLWGSQPKSTQRLLRSSRQEGTRRADKKGQKDSDWIAETLKVLIQNGRQSTADGYGDPGTEEMMASPCCWLLPVQRILLTNEFAGYDQSVQFIGLFTGQLRSLHYSVGGYPERQDSTILIGGNYYASNINNYASMDNMEEQDAAVADSAANSALKNLLTDILPECSHLRELILEIVVSPSSCNNYFSEDYYPRNDQMIGEGWLNDGILRDRILTNKPGLERLKLIQIPGITGPGLLQALAASDSSRLKHLEIRQCPKLTLSGFIICPSGEGATENNPLSSLVSLRYWPPSHQQEEVDDDFAAGGNFLEGFKLIPQISAQIQRIQFTNWDDSVSDTTEIAELIATFLIQHQSSKRPKELHIDAHCILIMTTDGLRRAVHARTPLTNFETTARTLPHFSCSEYQLRMTKGAANVLFSFSVK